MRVLNRDRFYHNTGVLITRPRCRLQCFSWKIFFCVQTRVTISPTIEHEWQIFSIEQLKKRSIIQE